MNLFVAGDDLREETRWQAATFKLLSWCPGAPVTGAGNTSLTGLLHVKSFLDSKGDFGSIHFIQSHILA